MNQNARPIRNAVSCGIVVPQFVTLKIGEFGFSVNITFNVDDFAYQWIPNHIPAPFNEESLYTFQKKGKTGTIRHYVTIKRVYKDLNQIYAACWSTSYIDRKTLKILMREAKIAELQNELNNIY